MRRARSHHKKGEKEYLKGNYELSELHYMAADEYREKALRQKGEL